MITALLIVLCIAVGIVIVLLVTKREKPDAATLEWLKSTQQELRSLQHSLQQSSQNSTAQISESMRRQTQDIHDRLSKATEVIGELKREAGAFSEVSRSMKDLHDFLKSPKLRGTLGEHVLNDLITQLFPKHSFFIQHRFKTGSIVDIAIQTDAGILPIDSKFPMENFQAMMKKETQEHREMARRAFIKDVKKHIDDISDKYILPEEGTMDFALMYIPSESVFYEIATDDTLLEYARERRVYPVSPTTLYAHLQTILLSFEGRKIELKSREVFKLLRGVQKEYEKMEGNFQTLGKHLTNAQNMYTSTASTVMTLGRGLQSMRQAEELHSPVQEKLEPTHD